MILSCGVLIEDQPMLLRQILLNTDTRLKRLQKDIWLPETLCWTILNELSYLSYHKINPMLLVSVVLNLSADDRRRIFPKAVDTALQYRHSFFQVIRLLGVVKINWSQNIPCASTCVLLNQDVAESDSSAQKTCGHNCSSLITLFHSQIWLNL
jgi:hypothetical protein